MPTPEPRCSDTSQKPVPTDEPGDGNCFFKSLQEGGQCRGVRLEAHHHGVSWGCSSSPVPEHRAPQTARRGAGGEGMHGHRFAQALPPPKQTRAQKDGEANPPLSDPFKDEIHLGEEKAQIPGKSGRTLENQAEGEGRRAGRSCQGFEMGRE